MEGKLSGVVVILDKLFDQTVEMGWMMWHRCACGAVSVQLWGGHCCRL